MITDVVYQSWCDDGACCSPCRVTVSLNGQPSYWSYIHNEYVSIDRVDGIGCNKPHHTLHTIGEQRADTPVLTLDDLIKSSQDRASSEPNAQMAHETLQSDLWHSFSIDGPNAANEQRMWDMYSSINDEGHSLISRLNDPWMTG